MLSRCLRPALAALVCLALAARADFVVPEPQAEFIDQTFDHFNQSDTRTYKQQVLIYDDYWKKNGSSLDAPLFIICGGEAPVRGGYNHDGLVFELASQLGAIIVAPEHRFYGASLPFGPEDSYIPSNLARLTVQQSLQDYAAVLDTVKQRYKLSSKSKVLSAGGSYPGELASYMRMGKMVDFALASSAPVRYRPFLTPDGTASGAFFYTATEVFGKVNKQCPDLVRQAFGTILQAFDPKGRTENGPERISAQLGLCTTIESADLLQLWIESAFATLVMENYPFAVDPFPAWPMKVACERMLEQDEPIEALRAALSVVYNTTNDVKCHNVREEYLECSDITGCGLGTDGRSWDYQFCTQVNSNADTNNVTDMFPARPFDFEALSSYCNKTFGVVPTPKELPGIFPPSAGDHIIYANGDIDGWFLGGILHSRPEDEVWSINVTLGAHHLDLRGDSHLDTTGVRQARQQERDILMRWLTEPQQEDDSHGFCCKEIGPNKVRKCVGTEDGHDCVEKVCKSFELCEHTCKN